MKKLALFLLSVIMILSLVACGTGKEPEFPGIPTIPETPASDFEYYATGDKNDVVISKYLGEDTAVHIPDKIKNFPVTSIEQGAFDVNTSVETLILPKHLEFLRGEVFANCSSLKSVTMEEGLQKIYYSAFMGTGLETVTIPDSVTMIDYSAFMNCKNLTAVKLGNGLTALKGGVFQGCTALEKVTLPENLETLESSMFMDCSSLEEVTLPKNLKKLGLGVFANASALKSITLPDGLQEIGEYAFYGTALEKVTIPASVEKIGDVAFDQCTALKSVTFLGNAPTVEGTNILGEPNKNTFGEPNKDLIIYYNPDASGWDTTPLKDCYTLVAK